MIEGTNGKQAETSVWRALWRHRRHELLLLGLIVTLILIPWLAGLAVGVWFITEQGWGWHWWVGSVCLITLGFWLMRIMLRRAQPARRELPSLSPGASAAEEQAKQALQRCSDTVTADDLGSQEAILRLIQRAFHAVAEAYSPCDRAALWRFTLPELLLMIEDFAQRLRGTLLCQFPLLRHIELSWAVKISELVGPVGQLLNTWRLLRWVDPSAALLSELRSSLSHEALRDFGGTAKAEVARLLFEQAGETAIKLYSGSYRRRADELQPTAPTPIPNTPNEPLTVLLAGRRNTGKSALLNALLGRARERVGLLTPTTEDCRAYEFESATAGKLILVDCPGAVVGKSTEPWLKQATQSDLVLWFCAGNRADRAADQHALAALDALTERDRFARRIPRVLVLTHADKLDPPAEWRPPYDPDQGQGMKEQQMREAVQAACEQLAISERHCALVAIRPGEPLWNAQALEKAILAVLPEVQQKQLERGMAPDGWFQKAKDFLVTVPPAIDQGGTISKRVFRQVTGETLGRLRDTLYRKGK